MNASAWLTCYTVCYNMVTTMSYQQVNKTWMNGFVPRTNELKIWCWLINYLIHALLDRVLHKFICRWSLSRHFTICWSMNWFHWTKRQKAFSGHCWRNWLKMMILWTLVTRRKPDRSLSILLFLDHFAAYLGLVLVLVLLRLHRFKSDLDEMW